MKYKFLLNNREEAIQEGQQLLDLLIEHESVENNNNNNNNNNRDNNQQIYQELYIYLGWISLIDSNYCTTSITKQMYINSAYKYFLQYLQYQNTNNQININKQNQIYILYEIGNAICFNYGYGFNLLNKSINQLQQRIQDKEQYQFYTNILNFQFGSEKQKYVQIFQEILQKSNDQYIKFISLLLIYNYHRQNIKLNSYQTNIIIEFISFIDKQILQKQLERQFEEKVQIIQYKLIQTIKSLKIEISQQQQSNLDNYIQQFKPETILQKYYFSKNMITQNRESKMLIAIQYLHEIEKYLNQFKFSDYNQYKLIYLCYNMFLKSECFRVLQHQLSQKKYLDKTINLTQQLLNEQNPIIMKLKTELLEKDLQITELQNIINIVKKQQTQQQKNRVYFFQKLLTVYNNSVLTESQLNFLKKNDLLLYNMILVFVIKNEELINYETINQLQSSQNEKKEGWFTLWYVLKKQFKQKTNSWNFMNQEVDKNSQLIVIQQNFDRVYDKLQIYQDKYIGFSPDKLLKLANKNYYYYIKSLEDLNIYIKYKTLLYVDPIKALQLLTEYKKKVFQLNIQFKNQKQQLHEYHGNVWVDYNICKCYIRLLRFGKYKQLQQSIKNQQQNNNNDLNPIKDKADVNQSKLNCNSNIYIKTLNILDSMNISFTQILNLLDEIIIQCQNNSHFQFQSDEQSEDNYCLIGKSYYLICELLKIDGDRKNKDEIIENYNLSYSNFNKFYDKSFLLKSQRLIPYEWYEKNHIK